MRTSHTLTVQGRTGTQAFQVWPHAHGGGYVQCLSCRAQGRDFLSDAMLASWVELHASATGMFACTHSQQPSWVV